MVDDVPECVVCFTQTRSVLTPCGHPVCDKCAQQWLARKCSCPVCRATVVMADAADDLPRIDFAPQGPAGFVGISLRNHRLGVKVTWLHTRDLAYGAGVRVGDVITHINGVQISDSAVGVAVVECARANRIPLTFRLHPRVERRWWRSCF